MYTSTSTPATANTANSFNLSERLLQGNISNSNYHHNNNHHHHHNSNTSQSCNSNALIGSHTNHSGVNRAMSSDTAYSHRSAGGGEENTNAPTSSHMGGGSSGSVTPRPFPPLPEDDDSDEEFSFLNTHSSSRQSPTGGNASNNRTIVVGGRGLGQAAAAAGGSSPSSLTVSQRELQTLEEFEALLEMNEEGGGAKPPSTPPPPQQQALATSGTVSSTPLSAPQGNGYSPPPPLNAPPLPLSAAAQSGMAQQRTPSPPPASTMPPPHRHTYTNNTNGTRPVRSPSESSRSSDGGGIGGGGQHRGFPYSSSNPAQQSPQGFLRESSSSDDDSDGIGIDGTDDDEEYDENSFDAFTFDDGTDFYNSFQLYKNDGGGGSGNGNVMNNNSLALRIELTSGRHSPTMRDDLSVGSNRKKRRMKRRRLKPIKVSKYLLGAVMGSGLTCTVRDAIDISKNNLERVAVKMLKRPERRLSKLSDRDRAHIENMIGNEVEMLQRFHHPNVMRALDCFTRAAKEYVVMPIAICSLQDFISIRAAEMRRRQSEGFDSAAVSRTQSLEGLGSRQGTGVSTGSGGDDRFSSKVLAPARVAKDIFLQVLAGVAYLHSQKVYHNDLKPSNILLFGDGNVKVSDLGCSGPKFDVGRHGTPAFVSPQVVSHLVGHENEGLVSSSEPLDPAKNDAWACGVILYQLLTGRLPFGDPNQSPPSTPRKKDGGGNGGGSGGGAADDLGIDDDDLLGGRRSTQPPGGATNKNSRGGGGAASSSIANIDAPQMNTFTVYRDIVYTPVDYDRVFEEGDADNYFELLKSPGGSVTQIPIPPPRALQGLGKGSASARHLVMGLLNKSQSDRLSVAQALQHPWLQDAIKRAPLAGPDHLPPIPNLDPTTQSPKAPGVAPPNSLMASTALKRVFDVAEIREMIEKDFKRHIQHVAEVCYIIRMELPPKLFAVPYPRDTRPVLTPPTRPIFSPSKHNCLYEAVNGSRFLSDADMRYYAQHKGRPDCDIATLRSQPQRRVHFYLYVDGLIRMCEDLSFGCGGGNGKSNCNKGGLGGSGGDSCKDGKNADATANKNTASASAKDSSSADGGKKKEEKAGSSGRKWFWCC